MRTLLRRQITILVQAMNFAQEANDDSGYFEDLSKKEMIQTARFAAADLALNRAIISAKQPSLSRSITRIVLISAVALLLASIPNIPAAETLKIAVAILVVVFVVASEGLRHLSSLLQWREHKLNVDALSRAFEQWDLGVAFERFRADMDTEDIDYLVREASRDLDDLNKVPINV